MQALLIFFSKSFAYFPHGTCSLSDSIIYFPLREIYHPICIPMPRNVIHQIHTVHKGCRRQKGISPSMALSFKRLATVPPLVMHCKITIQSSKTPFVKLSTSLFIRNYLRNPIWFIFHRLLICLNSAGSHASLHVAAALLHGAV